MQEVHRVTFIDSAGNIEESVYGGEKRTDGGDQVVRLPAAKAPDWITPRDGGGRCGRRW